MKKNMKKAAVLLVLPAAFAAVLALPVMNNAAMVAYADENEAAELFDLTRYATGDADTDEAYEGTAAKPAKKMLKAAKDRAASLPAQVDLSQTPFFPPIGDQMQVGSCYAWAAAYYQFTYEANKLNNITSNAANAYSPAFVNNILSGGEDVGGVNVEVYDLLSKQGCLHMADAPYRSTTGASYVTAENYDYSWSTDTEAMIEALNTRLTGHNAVTITSLGTAITGPTDTDLDEVKGLLADGKILNLRVQGPAWDSDLRTVIDEETGEVKPYKNANGDYEYVSFRAASTWGGHALTLVGYDDSVWIDVNANGAVDEAELGAFKIANSWGADWANDGYIWVSYDALNGVSAIPGDWEDNYAGSRIGIFDRGTYINGSYNVNGFYYIEVANKDVYYVGQITVDTDSKYSLTAALGRNTKNSAVMTNRTTVFNPDFNAVMPYTGTLVFDYADLCAPIGEYISGYNWFLSLTGSYNSASFRITDNLSNTIVDCGALTDTVIYGPISLVNGDLNYDGRFTQADVDYLAANEENLSVLQAYLAANMPQDFPIGDATYTISYEVANAWEGGKVINVTLTNTGDAPVNGWAIRANEFGGTVTGIWCADLLAGNVISCASYNAVIPVGGSVTFGYQIANPNGNEPAFEAITETTEITDQTVVLLDIFYSWGQGLVGQITITNNSATAITGWELVLRAENITITDASGYEVTDNGDGTITITCGNGTGVLAAGASISFNVTAAQSGTPSITVVSMTGIAVG